MNRNKQIALGLISASLTSSLASVVIADDVTTNNAVVENLKTIPVQKTRPATSSDALFIQEIVVSSQKREESSQRVPISMNVYSSMFLEANLVSDIGDLSIYTPGLEADVASTTQPQLYIRGLGTNDFGIGSDPSVGVYLDGVYIGRPGASVLSLGDIERIEVMKGPQGTLFGRNTSAGAISIISKKPSALTEGSVKATLGNDNKQRGEILYSTPLADNIFIRTNIVSNHRDGFIENDVNGAERQDEDDYSIRANTLWEIDSSSDLYFKIDHEVLDTGGIAAASTLSGVSPADPFGAVRNDGETYENREVYGTSLTYNKRVDDYTFTSIAAFRKYDSEIANDEDGTDSALYQFHTMNTESSEQSSIELRVNYDDDELRWFVGASYYLEDADQVSGATFSTDSGNNVIRDVLDNPELGDVFVAGQQFPEEMRNTGDFDSAAVFADLTLALSANDELTVGARYTNDSKEFTWDTSFNEFGMGLAYDTEYDPRVDRDKKTWNELTARIVYDHYWTDALHTYASVSEGYKAGGFNALAKQSPFAPETMISYEIGLKSSWLNNRLQFNSSAFFYDYEDLQVQVFITQPGAIVPSSLIQNASDAEGQGFEFELIWLPIEGLYLSANGSLLKTEFKDYLQTPGDSSSDRSGNQLPRAPEKTMSLAMEYEQSIMSFGSLVYRMDFTYRDEQFFYVENFDYEKAGDVTLTNIRLAYLPDRASWEFAFYVNNLFDKEYVTLKGGLGKVTLSPITRRGDERQMGLSAEYRF